MLLKLQRKATAKQKRTKERTKQTTNGKRTKAVRRLFLGSAGVGHDNGPDSTQLTSTCALTEKPGKVGKPDAVKRPDDLGWSFDLSGKTGCALAQETASQERNLSPLGGATLPLLSSSFRVRKKWNVKAWLCWNPSWNPSEKNFLLVADKKTVVVFMTWLVGIALVSSSPGLGLGGTHAICLRCVGFSKAP